MGNPNPQQPTDHLQDDKLYRMPREGAPRRANASVTAGLKCAPKTGANVVIKTYRLQPVAMAIADSVFTIFPDAKPAPIMPDPITAVNTIRPQDLWPAVWQSWYRSYFCDGVFQINGLHRLKRYFHKIQSSAAQEARHRLNR